MGLDIRLPIGLMFSLIGALLVITGLLNGADARSLNININLCGVSSCSCLAC